MRKLLVCVLLFVSCSAAGLETARPFVHSLQGARGSFCSAVVLKPGVVLTAEHCVKGEAVLALRPGGSSGNVVATGNDTLDLALINYLAPEAACPCAPLASSEARVDEPVYVIGFPRGVAQVITTGMSQGVHNNDRLPHGGPRLVMTAPAMGGNSGGGVFVLRDGQYQLVGILVEGTGSLTFAVPLVTIRSFIQGLQL